MNQRLLYGGALALSLAFACAAPKRPALSPLSELPERHREVWSAWLADDPAWPEIREEVRADSELAGFVADNLLRELLRAYGRRSFTTLGSERLGPFERARAELLRLPEPATPRLVELLALGNAEAATLAGDLLVEIGRPAVAPVAALLRRPQPAPRQRAAQLLGRLPVTPPDEEELVREALIDALARDGDWLVRSQAATSLAARGSRDRTTAPARMALVAALADPDNAVHVRAAEGLAALEDPEAVPALVLYLERCLSEGWPAGAMAAQEALRKLTRRGRGHRTPAEWHAVWREMRGKAGA